MNDEIVSYNPLYIQVKEVLLHRIIDEDYRKGETIPSESKLAEEFGTSVSTIRQALSMLVTDGFLIKKQGKGTYVSEQKTTLRFFSWLPETQEGEQILQKTIELFQQNHHSFTIECIPTSSKKAKKELMESILSGNAPDVAHIQSYWTSYFASIGAFESLETLLNEDTPDSQFYQKDLVGGMYREQLYSVAWGLSPVSLFVNKHVIQKAGISVPGSAMFLKDFSTICQELDQFYESRETYCYALSTGSEQETDFLAVYSLLQAFGGGFLDKRGDVLFNSSQNVAAFTWLRDFMNTCRVLQSNVATIRKRFARGEIAFISDGSWIKYHLEALTGETFEKNFDLVLNPVYPESTSYSWNNNHALAICSQSQHKLEAARFIDIMTNDYEISNYYYSQLGLLPINQTYLTDSMYSSNFYQTCKQQLTHTVCIPAHNAMFYKAIAFCIDAVKKILYQNVDIQEELNEKEYYLKMLYND